MLSAGSTGVGIIAIHASWENDWWRLFPFMVSYALYGALQVINLLRYLAPYIFRVALSDRPLVKMDEGRVSFRYRPTGSQEWRVSGANFACGEG